MHVLTFNSFPGSPLPYIMNGTPGIGQTKRLEAQVEELGSLVYDIACFQEIFSKKAIRAYSEAHTRRGFGILYTANTWTMGRFFVGAWIRLVFSTVFNVPVWLFMSSTTLFDQDTKQCLCLILLILGCSVAHFCLHEWTLIAFSSNEVHAGLVTCYRKSMFDLMECFPLDLPQSGDLMNVVQPRQCLVSRFRCKGSGCTICVANTHLNALGSPEYRLKQIKVLLDALSNNADDIQILAGDLNTTPDSIELDYLFSQGWSDTAAKAAERVVEPTWSNQNALTKGWLHSSSARLDFVLYKPRNSYVPEKYSTVMKGGTSDHYGVLVKF